MLGLGCQAQLKTTHKQEAHLEVLILEKGRWHGLLVSHCKKTPGSPDESSSRLLWTASLSSLVSAVWLQVKLWYATPGICAFQVFHVQIVWGKNREVGGWKAGRLININILMNESCRKDLSGLVALKPCWAAFLFLSLSLSRFPCIYISLQFW